MDLWAVEFRKIELGQAPETWIWKGRGNAPQNAYAVALAELYRKKKDARPWKVVRLENLTLQGEDDGKPRF